MTTWREDKRARNIEKHGVDLATAEGFDMDAAIVSEDRTENYGERRFRAIGPIGDDLYVYAYAENDDGTEHAISLRRAEPRERRYYARNI